MIMVIKMHHPATQAPGPLSSLFRSRASASASASVLCSPCKITRIPRVADDPAERSFRGDPANVVRPRCQSSLVHAGPRSVRCAS